MAVPIRLVCPIYGSGLRATAAAMAATIRALRLDRRGELAGGAAPRHDTNRWQPITDRRIFRHGLNIRRNAVAKFGRHVPPAKKSLSRRQSEVRVSGLGRGWDIRRQRGARLVKHGQQACSASLTMREELIECGGRHFDAALPKIGKSRIEVAIRHINHLDADVPQKARICKIGRPPVAAQLSLVERERASFTRSSSEPTCSFAEAATTRKFSDDIAIGTKSRAGSYGSFSYNSGFW